LGGCCIGASLGLDLGSLSGMAADVPRSEAVSAPWTAWTGAVRGEVADATWLALELGLTLLVFFERPRFDLREPARSAYVAPAVLFERRAPEASLSLAFGCAPSTISSADHFS